MTPEEAIYFLKGIQNENADYSMEEAISVIKEIQQYRLIKDATIGEMAETLKEYAEIGTVEQCRKAVDKQKLKKPVKDKYNHNCCPNCGWIVSGEGGYGEEFCPHCENCGQAIRWENLGKWKMSEIKLKPCPFCWSENVRLMSNETEDGSPCCINSDDELEAKYSYVHCYGCDMDFCPDSDIAKDVMEAWNRRAGGQNE